MLKSKKLLDIDQVVLLIFVIQCFLALPVMSKPISIGIEESTPVPVVAEWPISEHTEAGEHFVAKVTRDVFTETGEVIIPRGARVKGYITEIKKAGWFRRKGQAKIRFNQIVWPDNVQSVSILADGKIVKDNNAFMRTLGKAGKEVAAGAALGAITGFQFGGLISSASSYGMPIAIGAGAGAGLALVTFAAAKGRRLQIDPGLPMVLNLISMNEQRYKEQHIGTIKTSVEAKVIKKRKNHIEIEIDNQRDAPIALGNLQIVDSLGYKQRAIQEFSYFSNKEIPPKTKQVYKVSLPKHVNKSHKWLILTDSFNKEEFFRVSI